MAKPKEQRPGAVVAHDRGSDGDLETFFIHGRAAPRTCGRSSFPWVIATQNFGEAT